MKRRLISDFFQNKKNKKELDSEAGPSETTDCVNSNIEEDNKEIVDFTTEKVKFSFFIITMNCQPQFILLTGPPGVGKTTLVKKVIDYYLEKNIKIDGFYTEEVRDKNIRIGFDICPLQRQKIPLARICNETKKYQVGKYEVFPENISSFVIPVLLKPEKSIEILVIDEIGKMEFLCNDFSKAIEEIFGKSANKVLATIPLNFQNKILKMIKHCPKSHIIQVTHNNRNHILESIIDLIK